MATYSANKRAEEALPHGLDIASQDGEDQKARYVRDVTAAALIGTTPATLRRWRHERRGPRYAKLGSNVRYKIADLMEYASACVVETRDSQPRSSLTDGGT